MKWSSNKSLVLGGIAVCLVGAVFIITARSLQFEEYQRSQENLKAKASAQEIKQHTQAIQYHNEKAKLEAQNPEAEYVAATPRKLEKVFAKSLEGTDVDGRLKADSAGNLMIDLEVRDFFDYFLNTVGEVEPEVALAEIENMASAYLPKSASRQVMVLLEQYLAFKEEAVQLMSQPMRNELSQVEALEWAFNELKRVRRETMSPEAVEAFFSLEESYSEYTLEAIKIQADESLSSQEKASLISYHRERLPELIRQTEETVIAESEKHREVEHAIESASETELTVQLTNQGYKEDQIADIVAYQQSQKIFDERYSQYQQEKQKLLHSGLSAKDQSKELDLMRERYFSNEQELTQAKVRDLNG